MFMSYILFKKKKNVLNVQKSIRKSADVSVHMVRKR